MDKIIRIFFLLIFISGCTNSDDSSPIIPSCSISDDTAIQVNLVLRDTFSQESSSFIQGETIEFYLKATNTTNEPITLNFSSSQQYDFCIESTSGDGVWRWSADMAFLTVNTKLILPAQSAVEATETWDQTLLTGGNLAIGSYTAFGSFLDQTPTAQFNFTIQ